MAGHSGFSFDLPPMTVASGQILSNPQVFSFGSFVPSAEGQLTELHPPYRLRDRRHLNRKRHSSPAGGPAKKRRAEERMIGDLENLSITNSLAANKKGSFQRWRELEARLAAEPPDPDEEGTQEETGSDSTAHRVVLSDELQKFISTPEPALLPDVKAPDNSKALVLWQPPTIPPLPGTTDTPANSPEAAPPDEPAPEPLEVEEAPAAPAAPQPASPAYDFSPFCGPAQAAAWPGTAAGPFQFGGVAPSGWPAAGPPPPSGVAPSALAAAPAAPIWCAPGVPAAWPGPAAGGPQPAPVPAWPGAAPAAGGPQPAPVPAWPSTAPATAPQPTAALSQPVVGFGFRAPDPSDESMEEL